MSTGKDFYHHMLKHFGWTWLESHPWRRNRQPKERMATRLARAFRKRMERRDIEEEVRS